MEKKHAILSGIVSFTLFIVLTLFIKDADWAIFLCDSVWASIIVNVSGILFFYAITVVIHEFIHYIVARVLKPDAPIGFGVTALGPGVKIARLQYTRTKYQIVVVAPFCIFCIFLILYYCFNIKNNFFLLAFILNTSGSASDLIKFMGAFAHAKDQRFPL